MPGKALITVYLPNELKDELDAAAEALERPRNWVIVKAITEWLALWKSEKEIRLATSRLAAGARAVASEG